MSKRVWKSGPPPHVGWWNASYFESKNSWRWWDGERWSNDVFPWACLVDVEKASSTKSYDGNNGIEWNNYYPKNARVPRINPNKQ